MSRAIIDRQAKTVEDCLETLRRRAGALPIRHRELLEEAVEELSLSLEDLRLTIQDLHERNHQLQVHRESMDKERRRCEALLHLTQEAYLSTDTQGVIREANRAAAALLQRHPTALEGKSLLDFVVTEDHEPLCRVLHRLRAGGAMRKLEILIKPCMNPPMPVALTVAAVCDEQPHGVMLRWLLHDISDRRRAQDALRESEAELRMITSQMPSLVWTTDHELRLKHVVGAAIVPADLDPDAWRDKRLQEVFHTADTDFLPIAAHIRALNGEPAGCELGIAGKDFDIRVEPLRDANDRITGCIGLALDITERKRAEDKLRRLQTELSHAGRLSILGGMVTGLAHELNQPLTAIVSYTQACLHLLRSGAGHAEQLAETMEQIATQGLRAGEIIRRMRAFTRPKGCRRDAVDINSLVHEVAQFIDWEARQHKVTIRLQLDAGIATVRAAAVPVKQVILNLLFNAIHALDEADAGPRQITLRTASTAGDNAEIAVCDTGPGLSAAAIEHLFEPFFSTRPDGLGIGLAISRSIVEAQGGQLWAEPNADERGVSFRFTLPLLRSLGYDNL